MQVALAVWDLLAGCIYRPSKAECMLDTSWTLVKVPVVVYWYSIRRRPIWPGSVTENKSEE